MYFLKYRAEPDENSPERGVIRAGFAHVWVIADSPEDADHLSLAYMAKHHLSAASLELCFDSLDVPLHQLGAGESALLRRAQKYGIALDYIASPVDSGQGFAGFRPLNKPDAPGE